MDENKFGLVAKPEVEAVVSAVFDIEKGFYQGASNETLRETLKAKLRFEVFIEALDRMVLE